MPDCRRTWLRQLSAASLAEAPHLLLCPHAGAGAASQRALGEACASWSTPWSIQYPGRQDRAGEAPASNIRDIAETTAAEMAKEAVSDTRPVDVFGHSMGALVAFEVTRSLEQLGVPVRSLTISAAVPAHTVAGQPDHPKTDEGIVDRIVGLAGTDDAILADPELVALAVEALRADYTMIDSYSCPDTAQVSCPITVFGGDADPVAPLATLWGWGTHTSSSCTVLAFRGGHFYLSTRLAEVAKQIEDIHKTTETELT
ncbi:alpha/beta fold hydrolase [Corynebacterium sp. TAE3-ERU12]|nr:alpha/beta fold hydrolase [Corynebacterium sp. TAE3-ERU12]